MIFFFFLIPYFLTPSRATVVVFCTKKSPIFEGNKHSWMTRVLVFLPKATPRGRFGITTPGALPWGWMEYFPMPLPCFPSPEGAAQHSPSCTRDGDRFYLVTRVL